MSMTTAIEVRHEANPRRKNGLWVGGPPGLTFQTIKKKLGRYGIDLVQLDVFFLDTTIPKDIDVVLCNVEMTSHGSYDMAKAAAKKLGLPFVSAGLQQTKTLQNLISLGLVTHQSPNVAMVSSTPKLRVAKIGAYSVTMSLEATRAEGVLVTYQKDGERKSHRPVMIDEDQFFIDVPQAAQLCGLSARHITAALKKKHGNVEGLPVRYATWDETVYTLPGMSDGTAEMVETVGQLIQIAVPVTEDELDKLIDGVPALPDEPAAPKPEEIIMPTDTGSVTPIATLLSDPPKQKDTSEALCNEINEALVAMAKWPNLRIYLFPGLMKAQEAAL